MQKNQKIIGRLIGCFLLCILAGIVPLDAKAAATNASYYAIYCSGDGKLSLSGNDLKCGKNSKPAIETSVKTPSTDPQGAHDVTIVEADCYPNKPASGKIVGGSIPCTGGPDATLTLGKQFKAASNPGKGKKGKGGPSQPSATLTPITSDGLPSVEANDNTLQTVLRIVFGIIGAFAILNVTASGFKYITSAGDPQKTSEAKKGIVYSLVGLAIAITAEAIVTFLVTQAS